MDTAPSTALDNSHSSEAESIGWIPILGATTLTISALTYLYYGATAYPRQEWLLEAEISIIFLLPILTLIRRTKGRDALIRLIGTMLLLHSIWDALHWPGRPIVQTPVNPWLPWICPFFDLPLGFWLVASGNGFFVSREK